MIGRLQVGNLGRKVLFLFEQAEGGKLGIPLELNLRYAPYLLRFEDWKGDDKNAPLVKETRNGDVPAVGSGDGPRQTESQTDARGRSTLITSVESIKNARKIIWRYTNASIFDNDYDVSSIIL